MSTKNKKEKKPSLMKSSRLLFRTKTTKKTLRATTLLLLLSAVGISLLSYAIIPLPFVASIVSLFFVLMLLYPFFLGIYGYALALHEGIEEPNERLFAFFTIPRLRRFAVHQFFLHFFRFALLVALMLLTSHFGVYFSDMFLAVGDTARASLALGVTYAFLVALPIIFLIQELDFLLSTAVMLEDPTLSVFKARKVSARRMLGEKAKFIRLCLRFIPSLLLGFLTCGLWFVLSTFPLFIMASAGFACHALHRKECAFLLPDSLPLTTLSSSLVDLR